MTLKEIVELLMGVENAVGIKLEEVALNRCARGVWRRGR